MDSSGEVEVKSTVVDSISKERVSSLIRWSWKRQQVNNVQGRWTIF